LLPTQTFNKSVAATISILDREIEERS
jgi:hypothetical protein